MKQKSGPKNKNKKTYPLETTKKSKHKKKNNKKIVQKINYKIKESN